MYFEPCTDKVKGAKCKIENLLGFPHLAWFS